MKSVLNKHSVVLVLILSLALCLRLYNLTFTSPSLNWDETSIGYNAYSILKTSRDEWGERFPVHFKSFGEYKLPGQIYASIPAIAILGLNPFAVRITPVIYGMLTVLLMYFLGKKLTKNKTIGLISAFFLAVSPWHIQLTRASFESSFALFWVVLGMIFLIKGFKNNKYWIFSTLPFAAAVYTYNSARVFVPLFLLSLVPFYYKKFIANKKILTTSAVVFLIFMIPLFSFVVYGEGSARYRLVSVTDELGLVPRIEEKRNTTNIKSPYKQLLFNRYTYSTYTISKNYLAHFTPNFLFVKGAGHVQHHPQNIGELYWAQAPFLLLGAYMLFKKKNKFRWLIIVWLLTAFIPVSVTMDSIPHALRTLNAAPVYQILTAIGLVYVFKRARKENKSIVVYYLLLAVSVLPLSYQFMNYQIDYYKNYSENYSRDWQYGNKEVIKFISENYDKYDLIVYTREYGEPHIFTLFYLEYPPERYFNNTNLNRFETHDWVRVLTFDKFYFPDLGDKGTTVADIRLQNEGEKILFIGTDEEINDDENIVRTIRFLNGDIAFQLVE